MAFLASDVTAEVRQHLPSFYPDSNANALDLVNKAHATIVRDCGLYAITTSNQNLTVDVQEYALSPDVYRIRSAMYLTSANANSAIPLRETSLSELDAENKTWRYQSSNQPARYYEEGGFLGLYPKPNVSTTGGYPIVQMTILSRNNLPTLATALPPQVDTIDAWVWEVCRRWCIRDQPELLGLYTGLAREALNDLMAFTQSRLVMQNPSVKISHPYPRNR